MRILYVTDGSAGAQDAGRFLSQLPHRRDVHVHIVTAIDTESSANEGQRIIESAKATLGNFPGHITTGITLASSKARIVETILHTANYIEADLIALGASSHSPVARFFLGSITESVVRHARQAVLVVRAPLSPLKDVVLSVDSSPDARRATYFAVARMPLPSDCTLRFVHVNYPIVLGGLTEEADSPIDETALEDSVLLMRRYAEELTRERSDRSQCSLQTQVVEGSSESALIQVAEEKKAGLIIVGSHERHSMKDLLSGSISERIVRHAHCSVLVVKHPLIEK